MPVVDADFEAQSNKAQTLMPTDERYVLYNLKRSDPKGVDLYIGIKV